MIPFDRKVYSCETLGNHMQVFHQEIGEAPKTLGFIEKANWLAARLNKLQSMNLYNGFEKDLVKNHSMTVEQAREVVLQLERNAVLYFSNYDSKFIKQDDIVHLDKLKKLSKLSERLLKEFENTENDFYQFLHLFNYYEEKDEDEPSVSEFFENLIKQLDLLQSLPANLNETMIGEGMGIGSRSRKGNPSLHAWALYMIVFWFRQGRSFKVDINKISGRKQLVEFMWDCLQKIHPEVEHHSLDNVVRRIQKEMKNG